MGAALLIFVLVIQIAAAFFHNTDAGISNILIDNNKMKFSLKQGEVKQYPLTFTNAGKLSSYIDIVIDAIKTFVTPNKKSFEIKPKTTEQISLIAFAPNNQVPGIYEGKILVQEISNDANERITGNVPKSDKSTANIFKVLDSVMDISTKNTVFTVGLEPERIGKEAVAVKVDIKNNGAPSPTDVGFELYAKKIGSDIIDSKIKKINLRDTISFVEVMNVSEEKFMVYAKLRHNGEVLVQSDFYDAAIKDRVSEKGFSYQKLTESLSNNISYISAFFVLIVLLIVYLQKKRILKQILKPKAEAGKTKISQKLSEKSKEMTKLRKRLMALENPAEKEIHINKKYIKNKIRKNQIRKRIKIGRLNLK